MKNIQEKLPDVKENILLSDYTTFKIGGPAKYFFIAKNQKDLIKAIKTAKEFSLPFFILGGGSNVLASDRGYEGLIIKIQNSKFKIQSDKIYAEAGVSLRKIVDSARKNNLTGFEWAVGIPGNVGGAIYGNVGAFGSTIAENIESVKVLDVKSLKVESFSAKECKFNNKESIFKKNKNIIILSVILKLKNGYKGKIQKKTKKFLDYRKKNHPLDFPSAGCIFKNCDRKITNKDLLKKYPKLIEFDNDSGISASFLIDKCGLKGKKIGGAEISKKHANFIVNLGGAKAEDVVKLIKLAKEKVKNKFGIKLEEEIQYVK